MYSALLGDGWYVWVAKEPLDSNGFEDVQRDFRYVLKRVSPLLTSNE
jgi:hypothetical protein